MNATFESPSQQQPRALAIPSWRQACEVRGYLVAVVATAGMVLLRWLLDPMVGDYLPLATLYGGQDLLGRPLDTAVGVSSGYHAKHYGLLLPDGVTRPGPEDLPLFRASRYGEPVKNVELLIERPDGSRLAVLVDAVPIRSGSGEVVGAVNCWRDVTERKRTEEALRAIQEKWQIVTDAMSCPVTRCSRDLRYLWVSKPYADWIGRPPGEFIGRPIRDVLGDEAFQQLLPRFEQVLAGKKVCYEEEVNYRGLGLRWINAIYTPTLDKVGGPDGWVAVVLDVTEQKRAERLLRESESGFHQLADAMPQIVWAARPDGYLDYYNERWYEFTGFPRGEYGEASWKPILHPDDVQRCKDVYYACIKSGSPYQIEYRFKDRTTGSYRWFLGRASPVRDEQGVIVRWFGTCTDIDDTKKAEEALQEADRRKNEFLATLAHELRNPLAPIRNAVELLRRAKGRDDLSEQARTILERQLGLMVRLIDDLLDVSRITRGKLQLRKERVELAAVVRSAVEAARPSIEGQAHQLTVTLPPQPIDLDADPIRLAQVFSNLLTNAAKYTERGGTSG
jgi:PAS domain S-box-containing protein